MYLKSWPCTLILLTDHDPHVFPDPESFKPSRWSGVSEQNLTMFGIGPRSCIGRKFTQVEALTFLAPFLRDCRWHTAAGRDPSSVRGEDYGTCHDYWPCVRCQVDPSDHLEESCLDYSWFPHAMSDVRLWLGWMEHRVVLMLMFLRYSIIHRRIGWPHMTLISELIWYL